MEKEYVEAMKEKDFYQVFYQRDGDISELIKLLDTLNDNMPIGWTNEYGKIFIGWWGRIGYFYPKKEEFYDAFDHETYYTNIWCYSSSQENTVPGVEIHGKGSRPNPSDETEVVVMKTVGDVKTFLSQAHPDAKLFAPDTNFELYGSLDDTIRLHTVHDISNIQYLLISVDSEA